MVVVVSLLDTITNNNNANNNAIYLNQRIQLL
jgi:hypothetical protein